MVSKVRRVVAWFLLVTFLLATCLFASEMGVAWYRRWQASRILACVNQMRPGVTTEAQARAELARFAKYEWSCTNKGDDPASSATYSIYNQAEWQWRLLSHLPNGWADHVWLRWAMFEVSVDYREAYLAGFRMIEMQQDLPGFPHPNSASVDVLTSQFEGRIYYRDGPDGASGYSVHSSSTGEVGVNGKMTNFVCCHERFITVDERASAAQVAASENFQLRCMTSFRHCRSDRDILP
jgi:hypothetical protein